jgi:ubiquinone/menaquinone biosynthesis C-methylase UbiE
VSLTGRLFALFYDRALASSEEAGLADRRHELLAAAHGQVVEIGAGTGANLAHYPDAVRELVLVEPEEAMRARLQRRLAGTRAAPPARVLGAPAERLPLADESFDCAVSTLVLCSVGEQAQALRELRRVLRPTGSLLFIEHVRADAPRLSRWQDRLEPLWRRCGHGCRPNRDTLAAIEAAGFSLTEVEHGCVPKAPSIVRPMISGVAAAAK